MLTKLVIVLFILACASPKSSKTENTDFTLEKNWELSGFENPESVVLDAKNNVLYVSNVNGSPTEKDGNGYISKVSLSGKIIQKKWIVGLNAPKGLGIYKDKLYTSDIDEIVEIDIASGKYITYEAKDATFLNDVVIDSKGVVYASNTFGFSGIYILSEKKIELWLKSEKLNLPNGLSIQNEDLYVASWGTNLDPKTYETKIPGKLIKVSLKDKSVENISKAMGNLDGLSATIDGFLMSDWIAGKILYFDNKTKKARKLLDLPKGSADTYFDKNKKSLFIPLMMDNKLLKYSIKE